MRKEVRELIEWAAGLGWVNAGQDGGGHYKLTRNGVTARVPATPGGSRSLENARGDLRRLAGVGSDSPKAGRYRARRVTPLRTHLSRVETSAVSTVDALKAEWEELEARLTELRATVADSGRTPGIDRACVEISLRRAAIEDALAGMYRAAPPSDLPRVRDLVKDLE